MHLRYKFVIPPFDHVFHSIHRVNQNSDPEYCCVFSVDSFPVHDETVPSGLCSLIARTGYDIPSPAIYRGVSSPRRDRPVRDDGFGSCMQSGVAAIRDRLNLPSPQTMHSPSIQSRNSNRNARFFRESLTGFFRGCIFG